ncbi:MAG: FAD-dependent oxidoreductase, partial [Phormidesmis sp.]
ILGGTTEGRTAALTAAGYGARVALVEPPDLFAQRQQERFLLQGLQQLGETVQRQAVSAYFGQFGESVSRLNWAALLEWSAIAAQTQSAERSPAVMSASGVDVILERYRRLSRQLVVTTDRRRLSTRAILIAAGTVPVALASLSGLTTLPETVKIVGGSPVAILWAEAFCRLDIRVTLVAERFLPSVDEDIRRLVRSQLIASGAMLYQFDHHQTTPDCTLALEPYRAAIALPGFVYGRPRARPLKVNRQLQTAHPRVFVCGPVLGGTADEAIAEYEAKVAVRNALFVPNCWVDYEAIAQRHHRFASVGLTQMQAQQRYGGATQIWTASSANSTNLSQPDPSLLYCKLVCVNQRLSGVHLLGSGASELIYPLASMIGKPVKALTDTDRFPFSSQTAQNLADLVRAAAGQSQQSRWQVEHWRRDWAENWFNWRRSR